MRHVKKCTTIRYTLLTYVTTTFLVMRVIVTTKHALRKTTHSITAVVLAYRTSALCLLWNRCDASLALGPGVPGFHATNTFSLHFVES